MKTILMILNKRLFPDIRVEQECDALIEAGYRVVIVASEYGVDRDGYEIIRINPEKNVMSKIYNLTLMNNPILLKNILEELKQRFITNIDVIHVHDLYWGFIGLKLKKYFNAKLVIDLHENYPALIKALWKDYLYRKPFMLSKIIMRAIVGASRLKLYEKKILKKCDAYISVVQEGLDDLESRYGLGKGHVVSNTKPLDSWCNEPIRSANGKFNITYVGSIQYMRGLDTAVKTMRLLDESKYQLTIVGLVPGSYVYSLLNKYVMRYSINNVNLVNWVEEDKLKDYIYDSHICIVPHKDTEFAQTTIPHKLFMYMSLGRPVIVSDVKPLSRVVTESNCGLVFKAGDEFDLANKIKQMSNYDLIREYADNGRISIEKKYNWNKDKLALIKLYHDLLDK
ncbi:MAG: glycosyltransferase family 4 protein [Gammaproteobacteria bacterium]|nr:glycosyltransferase family 4 protein [Gammaproteobacteria bacterium]